MRITVRIKPNSKVQTVEKLPEGDFLVRVKAFAFKDGAREYTLEDLGGGVGLAEDASGYLF